MIKSMTGFGKAVCETSGKKITIEIRTLNSRNLDINIKLPAIYRDHESTLRNQVASKLNRGKTDIMIQVDQTGTEHTTKINRTVVKHYAAELNRTARELDISINDPVETLKIVMRMPDTLVSEQSLPDKSEWDTVYNSFIEALNETDNYRIAEGKAMQSDLENRIMLIEISLTSIDQFEAKRIETIRDRLQQNLGEFVGSNNIDRNRLEQEIIFYLEKLDITEEKVRLRNHIDYLRETLSGKEPSGKKVGFITQEIGREINTIGSKANDFNIQKLVVQMKDELEKIKEQSLNIL